MEIKKTGKGLALSGDCSIQSIETLAQNLKEALQSDSSAIAIDVSQVTAIDTAVLQLLTSARQSALQSQKSFVLTEINDVIKDALNLTGLATLFTER